MTVGCSMMPDWLRLPEELVASIAIRLTLISDYIRFGAVCTLWNSIATKNRHRLPGHLPWLLLQPTTTSTNPLLSSLCTCKKNSTSTSTRRRRVCGAGTGGWLIAVDDSTAVVSLFNPFTGFEIPLPPLATATNSSSCYLWKAVLSISPPAEYSGFVVMALYGQPRSHKQRLLALLYSRPNSPNNNDFSWLSLDQTPRVHDHSDIIADIICYKGRFYAVDNRGRLFECDIYNHHHHHSPPRLRLAATHLHEFHQAPAPERKDNYIHGNKRYLVESIQGDLLQAVVLCNNNVNIIRRLISTHHAADQEAAAAAEIGIEVFKHVKGDEREEMGRWVCGADDDEAAAGVGEQILVLGLYASFAFSASKHFADRPAPCKGTWIYNGGFCYPADNSGIFTYTMVSRKLAFLMFFKQNVAPRLEFLLHAEP
ncbi:hypothetical protein H6P81_008424 [Aristolochia fimbriata]|uniref:F-box protein n=1 Tax=Aristolochia fimbriata TaxID=158543 RepID=A0AAV7EIM8_ARIFI|nr:hypothetical protein H6P81_008424 [Aristolochia fimbriata]